MAVLVAGSFLFSLGYGSSVTEAVEQLLGPRSVGFPGGIAVSDDGKTLYVEHPSLDRLSRIDLDESGNFKSIATIASDDDPATEQLVTPDDLWLDRETGDLYVVELLVNGVRKISPDGTRTRILAGFGDGNQSLNGISLDAITGVRKKGGLCLPESCLRLFVSTFSLNAKDRTAIWEIDPDGHVPPRLVFGAVGGVDIYGQGLHAPDAMAFDPDGRELFVSEMIGGRVWAIDVDLHTARPVYDSNAGDRIVGAAFKFDSNGKIAYAEYDSGKLLRIDPSGPPEQVPLLVATLDPGVHNIGKAPDGRIFGSNIVHGGITVVEEHLSSPTTLKELLPRSLNVPNGIAVLSDGPFASHPALAISDLASVAIVDPDKTPNSPFERPWVFLKGDAAHSLDLTTSIATIASPGGCDAYATAFSRGTLQHINLCDFDEPSADMAPPVDVLPPRTFAFPADVVSHGTELWVSDLFGLIWHVVGLPAAPQASPLDAVFQNPTGLALSPDGQRLYVSDSAANEVRVIDPITGLTLDTIPGLAEPEGLAFDSAGDLLVVEAAAGRLTRVHKEDGSHETMDEGLRTHLRGVSVIPQFNFFADVAVLGDDIFVTSPEDGSLTRIHP